MEGIENETTLVQREDAVMQAGDTEHYRVYCYFPSTPTRNFEWFYVELDANSCNTSIGHLKRAQEYIYVIEGVLELETGVNHYRLQSGDGFVFDASIAHTYQNHQNTLLRMMIINYYLGS